MPKKQYRILAVDDEKFNLLLLQACLKGAEYAVETCSDALQALTVFKKNDYDVILLDIMMAGIDGFEVRDLIRTHNRKIPIIFLTSLLDDINSTMINRITADKHSYYLNKSFNRAMLIAKIEEAVRGYRDETEADLLFRQIDADLALAGEVQRIMMPGWCVSAAGMFYSYLYEPAFRVSGDLFEFFELPDDRALFIVGDIAGHGVQAALYMTALQSFLKTVLNEPDAAEIRVEWILDRLNDFFFEELNGENYMTCLVVLFDFRNNIAEFHNAGHPGLLCCSARTGEVREGDPSRKSGSIPIGWKRNYHYKRTENVTFHFSDDDIFLLYTDGLLDLVNPEAGGQELQEEEFRKLAGALALEGDVATMPFRIRNAFDQLGYTKAEDDVFLLAVHKFIPNNSCFTQIISPRIGEAGKLVAECGVRVAAQSRNTYFTTQLELLLSEFLNNVIQHGFNDRKTEKNGIAVKIQLTPKCGIVEVVDRGKLWSNIPEESAAPGDVLERLNSAGATSGRGLAIIRSIASSIIRRHHRGINQTIFTIPYPTTSERL